MPFRHLALYRWADHVDADHVRRVRDAFDGLAEEVTGLVSHTHGTDVGVSEGTFDYLVVADFHTIDAWRAYRDHPAHVLLQAELITGHVVEQAGGQFPTSESPRTSADAPPAGVAPAAAVDTPPFDTSPADGEETDEELLARARQAALDGMQALLAEPDDTPL